MNKGLGRGLSSLIPPKKSVLNTQAEAQASAPELQQLATIRIVELPLASIDANPSQPRKHFDPKTLDELAESIREYGLLEPIIVTPDGNDRWQIVAGERRFRAFTKLGKKTISAIVRSTSELERLELALIENIQRQDLNPIEKAQSFATLMDEFGLTQVEAAKKMGIARSSIANSIRLLELPSEVQVALAENQISEGHAKVLLSMEHSGERVRLFRQMMQSAGPVSVRELESMVKSGSGGLDAKPQIVDHELRSIEDQLQAALGTRVHIKKSAKGKANIVIETYSPEEFKSVIRKLQQ